MQKYFFTFLSVLTTGLIHVVAQPTKIDVQTGQKYRVETSTKLTSSAEAMGQTLETNSDAKITNVYEILGIGQDGISLQSTITKILVSASMMGQSMDFDSDKKNNEGPLADMLSKMVNQPKGITLDMTGSITKQDTTENGMESSMIKVGTSGNDVATELFIPALIGKEIRTGDSFSVASSVKKEKFSSTDSGNYKIAAIENGIASVSYSGTQVISATMEQMGMEMTNNSNNVVKSELQVDLNTGMVLAKATIIESTSSIEAAGMLIPSSGKTITTVKITTIQ